MTDKNIQKLIDASRKVKLSEGERSAARQSVFNFIKMHPLKKGVEPRFVNQSGWQWGWSALLSPRLSFASVSLALLFITVLVGGGISIGAERALPGDILYPVKVDVNEEVKSWLSTSDEAKADWEVQRAQRRLEEAEELATQGSLNTKVREKIETKFKAHADKVKERIQKFENKDNFKAADDVSSKFESSLNAHQKILDRLTREVEDKDRDEVRPIEVKVRSEADSLIRVRRESELRRSEGSGDRDWSEGDENRDSDVIQK